MTIGDKLLILFVLLIVGLTSYKTYLLASGKREVAVSVSGKQVRVFLHDEFSGTGIYRVPLERGEVTIEIDCGRVRILPMQRELCPRGICSEIGWIERPGEAAICVPNRLIVEVRGKGAKREVDAISR